MIQTILELGPQCHVTNDLNIKMLKKTQQQQQTGRHRHFCQRVAWQIP